MTTGELIERVMTEHWDMIACWCRFCREARQLGFRPRNDFPTNPKVSILKGVDNGIGYDGEAIQSHDDIGDLLNSINDGRLDVWDAEFIKGLRERYAQYGERVILSAKQRGILERIAWK